MAATSSDSLNGVRLPESEPTVVLTGFGLFREYGYNSSSEVVKALAKTGIPGIKLVTREVPVEYDAVMTVVPQLWQEFKPDLVVHCGMNATARNLVVENQANNGSYCAVDNRGIVPKQCRVEREHAEAVSLVLNMLDQKFLCRFIGNAMISPQNERLRTCFDLAALTEKLKTAGCPVPVDTSDDAGRYLCEFIYFTSLRISPWTIFIHVPPIGEPYSIQQLACTVSTIVLALLEQKRDMTKSDAGSKHNQSCHDIGETLGKSKSEENQTIVAEPSESSSS